MSLQCSIVVVFVLLCFFVVNNFHVKGTLTSSIAKTRRTQSMRSPTSHKNGNNLQAQSGSSLSSTASLTELKATDSQPSTSNARRIDSMNFREIDLQPHTNRLHTQVDLHDASAVTHNSGNINPARDGVYARVRNAMLRYGAAAAIGSAIGATGIELKKMLYPDNNNNNNNITENITENITLVSNEINNPL